MWLRCPIEPSSCRLSDDKDVRLDNEEEHSRIFQVCLELFRLIYQYHIHLQMLHTISDGTFSTFVANQLAGLLEHPDLVCPLVPAVCLHRNTLRTKDWLRWTGPCLQDMAKLSVRHDHCLLPVGYTINTSEYRPGRCEAC